MNEQLEAKLTAAEEARDTAQMNQQHNNELWAERLEAERQRRDKAELAVEQMKDQRNQAFRDRDEWEGSAQDSEADLDAERRRREKAERDRYAFARVINGVIPGMDAKLRAERQRREELERLANYASHAPGCAWDHGSGSCDCGLAELEALLSPSQPPEYAGLKIHTDERMPPGVVKIVQPPESEDG